ncbi:xanthine dehydrogenase subunit D [Streptomyces sp. NPDC059564]|uniref:xanthine dehydrogenase subunit D n=1 Tax=Streptomyces sp. NPDC059564 TaxID=3346865 RepID=UPI003695B362
MCRSDRDINFVDEVFVSPTPSGAPEAVAVHQAIGIGGTPPRPDGAQKVQGSFAYSSDLRAEGMLWGATLRSPHPSARIRSVNTSRARALAGVAAVLTHEDVPGSKFYGLERRDQPVLAVDEVRYQGEPIALVAAGHPETARRALALIEVEFEVREPLTESRLAAFDPGQPSLHPQGNLVRHQPIRSGDAQAARRRGDLVVVRSEFEIGMQDQAFLGPESGMAVPDGDGGIDLYVATQWLHHDKRQIVPVLGLAEERVRLTLAGVGGAFGGREDISVQIHMALLALATGRPVKMSYGREESFLGHVHRHPARMRYEYGATRDGRLVYADVEIVFDGGAYTSATPGVVGIGSSLCLGPYEIPHIKVDVYGVFTNNPPCGAMRGFGGVQGCFAYESMMDRLASELGMEPLEIRRINAITAGSRIANGQAVDAPQPFLSLLDEIEAVPLPEPLPAVPDPRDLPGGLSGSTRADGVVRGIGYGVGMKNACFSGGDDDYGTARIRLAVAEGEVTAHVHTAAAEVGQGLTTVEAQIARTELGIERIVLLPPDTSIGDSGGSSASRQTYMTGGAVKAACEAAREELFRLAVRRLSLSPRPGDDLRVDGGKLVSRRDGVLADLADVLGTQAVDVTREYHHRPTSAVDPLTGLGDSHVQLIMCVHRAVVDVDVDLGLVRVVALDAVQDVGRVINRGGLEGQIHGGSAQGLGLALMEEIVLDGGRVRNASFTDYLIPTTLDVPRMKLNIVEHPDPRSPYGLRGAGEAPTLSATPAIVSAVRAATGLALTRIPLRPHDIALGDRPTGVQA